MKRFTLDTFYQSTEWHNFRQVVIQERADKETGLVFCEYCGKPIVGSGQIVCHHIEELNEFNINDANITLNPANISLVHINCHNNIHSKFINCKKEVFLLYGPPTSYFEFLENEVGNNDIIVCLDWIYKGLNPQNPLFPKTRGLFKTAMKVRDTLMDYVRVSRSYGQWSRAFIAGGYPYERDREELCDALGIPENNVKLFYMTREEAIENAKKYKAPRSYEKFINEWYEDYHTDNPLPLPPSPPL